MDAEPTTIRSFEFFFFFFCATTQSVTARSYTPTNCSAARLLRNDTGFDLDDIELAFLHGQQPRPKPLLGLESSG
jgi:hypothetical protein